MRNGQDKTNRYSTQRKLGGVVHVHSCRYGQYAPKPVALRTKRMSLHFKNQHARTHVPEHTCF
jgi:hypothetical protein